MSVRKRKCWKRTKGQTGYLVTSAGKKESLYPAPGVREFGAAALFTASLFFNASERKSERSEREARGGGAGRRA